MNHPLSAALLTLAMLAALTACSSQSDSSDEPATTPSPVDASRPEGVSRARVEEIIVTGDRARRELSSHEPRAAQLYHPAPWPAAEAQNRERYAHVDDNPVKLAAETPVSTFSIDVDTASYSNIRRLLGDGALPPADAVRIEELINYFSYDYPAPEDGEAFSVITEVGPAPWHPQRRLMHIGIQGARVDAANLPPANLVFLIDVSGSMQSPDKIDLLKTSMKLLTRQLDGDDRVSIAVYAGAAGTVLAPTPGDRHGEIQAAIDRLQAGGSTNGGAGIHLAYAMARQAFIEDGINRVILATDGDFNVGTTDLHALEDLVTRQRESGVALTILGFGGGNYNDALMQTLAQAGNGNAAYVDNLNEARKVLVDELGATLEIIASDVKIQVEFNPAVVAEYRLLGYETRLLRREDFNNDKVDAGDIGAGHTVTALYELTLHGRGERQVDPLRYPQAGEGGARGAPADAAHAGELAFVRLRHKLPGSDTSTLIEMPVYLAAVHDELNETSNDFRFSAAVAGFGALLRGGEHTDELTYDDVVALAQSARGTDAWGYRGEFLGLVRTAAALQPGGVEPGTSLGQR